MLFYHLLNQHDTISTLDNITLKATDRSEALLVIQVPTALYSTLLCLEHDLAIDILGRHQCMQLFILHCSKLVTNLKHTAQQPPPAVSPTPLTAPSTFVFRGLRARGPLPAQLFSGALRRLHNAPQRHRRQQQTIWSLIRRFARHRFWSLPSAPPAHVSRRFAARGPGWCPAGYRQALRGGQRADSGSVRHA